MNVLVERPPSPSRSGAARPDPLCPKPALPALEVEGLEVRLGRTTALSDIDLSVAPGEILAVVGPSGSGKSALARAVLGLLLDRPGHVRGRIAHRFRDGLQVELRPGRTEAARLHRGRVGLVLQSGKAALEPGRRLGSLFEEVAARRRPGRSPAERRAEVVDKLAGLELSERVLQLPVEALSGGMAQRAMLALADLGEPELLVLDEPTTGLDTTAQARLVEQLWSAHERRRFTALLVTHDVGIARALARRVAMLKAGRLEGTPPAETLRPAPVGALLPRPAPSSPLPPALSLASVRKSYHGRPAVDGVCLEVPAGGAVALVGASGSGKTSIARLAAGLEQPDSGEVRLGSRSYAGPPPPQAVRILFQNPYSSLNPEQIAVHAVAELIQRWHGRSSSAAKEEALHRLLRLGVEPDRATARIGQLSGGQRRRVALARSLVGPTRLLVLDEPSTGLDPGRRSLVEAALADARAEDPDRALLIVSHDLRFVRSVADRVVVIDAGKIVDDVPADALDHPDRLGPLTRTLLEDARRVRGELPFGVGGALVRAAAP